MSSADAYLEALRRELPFGYRRRFVLEVREHFDSAVAAEAERGVARAEAERLTIERLGPPQALAGQLVQDLRSGALGRFGLLAANLTISRIVVAASVAVVCVVAGIALVGVRSSRPAPPPPPQQVASPRVQGLYVQRLILTEVTQLRLRVGEVSNGQPPVKVVYVPSGG